MIQVLVVTEDKSTLKLMAPLMKSRICKTEVIGFSQVTARLKNESIPDVLYLDIAGLELKDIRKKVKAFFQADVLAVGILDPGNEINDPAELFHLGISDYLGKQLLKNNLKPARLKKVIEYAESFMDECEEPSDTAQDHLPSRPTLPGGDWDKAEPGTCYAFTFLFVEMDLPQDWKKKAGTAHLKKVKELFHNHIKRAVEPSHGRIWMWNEFGGVVLFPLVDNSSRVVQTAARLMLNRILHSMEDFPFKTVISYRMALHTGETVYHKRGETGTIVSDTVNFIFHLGQKFAKPGQFYITKEIFDTMHPGFRTLFLPEGNFENREVFRMRSPLR
jgi:hypothetical protein